MSAVLQASRTCGVRMSAAAYVPRARGTLDGPQNREVSEEGCCSNEGHLPRRREGLSPREPERPRVSRGGDIKSSLLSSIRFYCTLHCHCHLLGAREPAAEEGTPLAL